MKFIKSSLVLFMALLYVPSSLFCAAPATQKYISATVSISADRFVSLEKAFESVQREIAQVGLQANPIQQKDYHMTLVGFNLAMAPGISPAGQDKLKKDIEHELGKAAHDALKKSLEHLKKVTGKAHEPIVLEFSHIGIFQRQVVAIFEMNKVVQILVNTIENYFKNNIQNLLNNGTLIAIEKHQDILQPHVSLAKITNAHSLFGAGLTPTTLVADFHIGKPVSIISVQLRNGAMPAMQQPFNKPVAAQAMQPGMGAVRAPANAMPAAQPMAQACGSAQPKQKSDQVITLSHMMPLYRYLESQRKLGKSDLSIVDEMLGGQSEDNQLRLDVYNMYFDTKTPEMTKNREIMEAAMRPQLAKKGLSPQQINANARGYIQDRLRWKVATHILSPGFRGQDLQVRVSEIVGAGN